MNRANAIVIGAVVLLAGVAMASSLRGGDPSRASAGATTTLATVATTVARRGPGALVEDVSPPGHGALDPQVVASPDGSITAVWRGYDGKHMRLQSATRAPGSGRWSRAEQISPAGADALTGLLVVGGDGALTAVWEDPSLQVARLPAGATTWSAPTTLAPPVAVGPAVATATSDGRVTLVWVDSSARDRLTLVSATLAPSSTAWSRSIVSVLPSGLQLSAFAAVASGSDQVAVVWAGATGPVGACDRVGVAVGGPTRWRTQLVARQSDVPFSCAEVAAAADVHGAMTVAWLADGLYVASHRPSGRWTAPVVLGSRGASTPLLGGLLAVPGGGDLLVAEADLVVSVAARSADGRWSQPVSLTRGPEQPAIGNEVLEPCSAIASSGSAIVAWMASEPTGRAVVRIVTRVGITGPWLPPVSFPAGKGLHGLQVAVSPDSSTATLVWQTMPASFTTFEDDPTGVIRSVTIRLP